jgi:hypothetical protein
MRLSRRTPIVMSLLCGWLAACAPAPELDPVPEDDCGQCDGDPGDPTFFKDDGVPPGAAAHKPWTMLIYFATHVGSETLKQAVRNDLKEMRSVGSGTYANVIVEYHRPETGVADGAEDLRLELPAAPVQAGGEDPLDGWKVVGHLGDSDSGSADTLADFLTWGIKTYPAQRFAVILHGHGLAWQGFGLDEPHGTQIAVPELSSAFERARSQALGGDRFELVMFDACLMGTIEVAAEMQPHARYFLSSENVELSAGQPYATVLPYLTRHPRMVTPHILANMAHGYVYGYSAAKGYRADAPPTALTLVGLDLDKLDGLTAQLTRFADATRRATSGGLASAQVKALLSDRQMAIADDEIHSADLYQVLAGAEVAPWADDASLKAARAARDFIGYPRDGYNPAERAVVVSASQPGTVVFGLDGWSRGDDVTGAVPPLAPNFEAAKFGAAATAGALFPGLKLVADPATPGRFVATFRPFIPLAREFDWVIIDEAGTRAIATPRSVRRERDYYVTQSFPPDSPFIVEAHTQGYYFENTQMVHGLGVFFGTILPDFTAYTEGRFATQSGWGCLFKTLSTCPVPPA